MNELRFLRLAEVLTIIPVSKSVWYQGIKDGIYPAAVHLSRATMAWRSTDIARLADRISSGRWNEKWVADAA